MNARQRRTARRAQRFSLRGLPVVAIYKGVKMRPSDVPILIDGPLVYHFSPEGSK